MSASIIPYERSTLMSSEKYIGLDVHQATISIPGGANQVPGGANQVPGGTFTRSEPAPFTAHAI